jgi:protein-tyrosine-phosphatase
MKQQSYNVLFLCTGNSARSIIAECVLRAAGDTRFFAFSAGSHPRGEVHPYAMDLLKQHDYDIDGLRSKSWDEFAGPDAPLLDVVLTMCDDAASEVCPVWPGQPMTAHWGLADPAAVGGSEPEQRAAFAEALRILRERIDALVKLPIDSLDKPTLKKHLLEIASI